MAYTRRPFNPLRPYVNQIISELNQANNNFDILAKAFQNDDPSTLIVKRADTVDGFHASRTPAPNTIPVAGEDGKISIDWLPLGIGNSSNTNADTVGGFRASRTPAPNTIPVAGEDGKISIDWLPQEIVNRSNQTLTTIPYWTVYIDISSSNTTPTDFFTSGRPITIIRRWMSYGVIFWRGPEWGGWSTLWTMRVRSPVAFTVPVKIVSVYDYVYIYLNNRLVAYGIGSGVRDINFELTLVSGDNLIQIVHNNRNGSAAFLLLDIEFDWRVLEFIPT